MDSETSLDNKFIPNECNEITNFKGLPPVDLLMKFENKSHLDTVCPQSSDSDEDIHRLNEYVFNHLPLKEEQKEWLLIELKKDQKIKERETKNKEIFKKPKKKISLLGLPVKSHVNLHDPGLILSA